MTVFAGLKMPKVIYEADSQYNGKIQVVKQGEVLKLRVKEFNQSISHSSVNAKKMVWGQLVDLLKEQAPDFTSALILGLGGGTMQHYIAQAFPNVHMTSVEIDPVMIDVARKYFDLDTIPNHRVINEDACRVVIELAEFDLQKDSFDVAIVDIFIGDVFPDLGSSGNFLAALKSLVRPGGLVVFNRIYLQRYQDDVNNFIDLLENFFQNVDKKVVAGYTNSDNALIYGRVVAE